MSTYISDRHHASRAGNALVIALGFSVLVVGLITAASTSSTAVLQDNLRRTAGLKARAAVEAVLQRYESSIIAKAQTGELLTWTGDTGQEANFGQDYFGECRVKWKIEPCRTVRAQDVGATPGSISYMTNPSPSTTTPPNIADGEQANDYIYLYQVSAEARLGDPTAPTAVAQGVRYVSINEQPLFRYVIFYAQRGAKGDIEFSHGPLLSINGNVHSNGAIYLGSSTQVNNWGAVDPPNGDTVFGPNATGGKVLVEGVDGIFRLNKPLMYGGIDKQLNAGAGGVGVISGTMRGAVPIASSYDLLTPSFINETTLSPPAIPDLTSLDTATQSGRVVNPFRIKDNTGFITGAASGIDLKRRINGKDITGDWNGVTGNDSRDTARSSKFATTSIQAPPSGWGGYVRTGLTNCQYIKIPKEITGGIATDNSLRPLEAQRINAKDPDVDPTTDNHEAAMPVFASAGATTETIPAVGDLVEIPGLFATYALIGSTGDVGMKRLANGRGWSVTNTAGTALPVPLKTGLVIRERPIPETAIWPGAAVGVSIVDPSSKDFMPFAYGKHWRPSNWPFTSIDVSDEVNYGRLSMTSNQLNFARISTTTANRQETYTSGGQVRFQTAQWPGPSYPGGRSDGPTGYQRQRYDYFYDENWRFIHLNKPAATVTAGLKAYYFVDTPPYRDTPSGNNYENLRGTPFASRVDAQVNSTEAGLPLGMPLDNYSIRWEGFVTPPTGGTYTFEIRVNDTARLWVNGKLLISQQSSATVFAAPVTLQGNQPYSVVVETADGTGGSFCQLWWTRPGSIRELIPAARFTQPADTEVFDKATFTAVQARIDTSSLTGAGADRFKVGVMVREHHGLSKLQNGRNPYVAMLMSPIRGFFSQARLQAAETLPGLATDSQFFVGRATWDVGSTGTELANGNLQKSPTDPDVTRYGTVRVPNPWPPVQTNNAPGTWTQLNESTGYSGIPTFSINLGDGSPNQNVQYGPRTITNSVNPTSYAQQYSYIQGSFPLDAATMAFAGKRFSNFTAPSPTFNDVGKNISLYPAGTGPASWVLPIQSIMAGGSGVNLLWQNWSAVTSSPAAPGNAMVTYGSNDATGVTIWNSGITRSDSTVMTNAELVTWLNNNRNVSWVSGTGPFVNGIPASTTSGTSGGWSWTATTPVTSAVPGSSARPIFTVTYTAAPAPVTSVVNATPLPPGADLMFSVDRSVPKDASFDTNSYISSSGTWFDTTSAGWTPTPATTNVPANLPWLISWDAQAGQPASSQVIAPNTGSFRPDLWSAAVPPLKTNLPISITGAAPGAGMPGTVVRWADDQPAIWNSAAIPAEVWVRIVKDTTTIPGRTLLRTFYYQGAVPPASAASFTAMPGGVSDITNFSNLLQVGLCAQSGNTANPIVASFTSVRVETTLAAPNDIIDATDWDNGGGLSNAMGRYLASQYQVFWGASEITEDFFNYAHPTSNLPITSEDWFYNPREFWSQSRLWDDGTAKDSGTNGDGSSIISNRLLWAKTTLLSLDMGVLQAYLTSRLRSEAERTPFTNPAFTPSTTDDFQLSTRFTGLIYAARTNRYPWNPDDGSRNPFSPAQGIDYPNAINATAARLSPTSMASAGYDPLGTIHNLQPYDNAVLPKAPPFKPQDFHHGVRLRSGATMTWGYTFPMNVATQTPAMTESRTTIVTPGQLFLHGNLNTGTNTLWYQGAFVNNKTTPMAVMGDTVTLLSNNFQDLTYQSTDIRVFPGGSISGTSPMVVSNGAAATTTTYNTAIVTNNQPTTRQGVREGQGAPVIDTLMYLENWTGQTMNYKGSLVVMDSRRYTRAFLLDVPKTHGRSMMGTLGWNAAPSAPDWTGAVPMPYAAPARVMLFNDDLLTEEGTPPFAPFGVTASGIGGWVKTVR